MSNMTCYMTPTSTSTATNSELADRWGDYRHRDNVNDGVTYIVKYLGSTLVEELNEDGASYGDHISAEAVHTVVSMAKASNYKNVRMMCLNISPRGIKVSEAETQLVYSDLDIYRICFCTADRVHGKVFAYIARNTDNETMECHTFLCGKRKIAQAISLTVAESFRLAQDQEQENTRRLASESRQQNTLSEHAASSAPSKWDVNVSASRLLASAPAMHRMPVQIESPTVHTANTLIMTNELAPLGFQDNFVDFQFVETPHGIPSHPVDDGIVGVSTIPSNIQCGYRSQDAFAQQPQQDLLL